MSHSDPDLHTAISMRPHPFHAHPDPQPSGEPGQSTAYQHDGESSGEAVNRPVYTRSSSEHDRDDVERQSLPNYNDANDPYQLRSGLKSADELDTIKANTARKRSGCTPISQPKDALKARKIKKYYEAQNERIEQLLKPVDEHVRLAKEEQGSEAMQFQIAVKGSFVANIILAGLQLYGAASSGSLSLFTTMADSIFDPLSNLTLILCARAVKRVDHRRFPSGKSRIENAGNIAFCFLMIAVGLILIVESIRSLVEGNGGKLTGEFHLPSVIAVAVAFSTKLCLFLYCFALRNKYSQIRILWEDHRNDLAINGFGIMTSVLGSRIRWYIDPIGAIVLSALIACLWTRTAIHEFQLLIGVSAETSFLQHITYISMTHSPLVKSLDTVRAWHSGPRVIVEVDIVMDQDMTLKETHDVAEELQMKVESLPNVERAYVHVDYETSHAPERLRRRSYERGVEEECWW